LTVRNAGESPGGADTGSQWGKTQIFDATCHSFPTPNDYKLSSGCRSAKALEDLLHWLLCLSITMIFPLPLGASNVETSLSA